MICGYPILHMFDVLPASKKLLLPIPFSTRCWRQPFPLLTCPQVVDRAGKRQFWSIRDVKIVDDVDKSSTNGACSSSIGVLKE